MGTAIKGVRQRVVLPGANRAKPRHFCSTHPLGSSAFTVHLNESAMQNDAKRNILPGPCGTPGNRAKFRPHITPIATTTYANAHNRLAKHPPGKTL